MNTDAIKDGGAAYPVVHGAANGDGSFTQNQGEPGMSLRDHFAGLAMQARLSDYQSCQSLGRSADANGISFGDEVAAQSYAMADAMIRTREA